MKHSLGFVIPTKDRPEEIKKILENFESQSTMPEEIVVVDSGQKSIGNLIQDFNKLNIKYIKHYPPSISGQCNSGIKALSSSINLIGIVGDDVEFKKDAIKKMLEFWKETDDNLGGVSFNLINHPEVEISKLKRTKIAEKLGLYSNEKGKVMKSGFHTMIGTVESNIYTEWISTCASVWRREVLEEFKFDEWFEGYSYLEDLDFSYRVGKKWKLAVVADAKFYHHHASSGRGSGFQFGKREVINRIYFVKKYKELSIAHCISAIIIRIFISAVYIFKEKKSKYYIGRILGNLAGFLESF